MSRVKGSDFDRLVTYLNTFKEGDIIYRRDLLEYIYNDPHKGLSTVDKWRRQFTICEYLEETNTPGVYKRGEKHIPDWLTSSELEACASHESFAWYLKHDPSRIDKESYEQ